MQYLKLRLESFKIQFNKNDTAQKEVKEADVILKTTIVILKDKHTNF